MLKSFLSYTLELVKVIVISLAIIIPIRYFLIQPFYVKGASMEPSFHDHEYLVIDEISYRLGDPKRGDVIVFRYPRNPQEFFIKRVIGLPGEKVQIKDGDIYIYSITSPQGEILKEPYLSEGEETYSLIKDVVTLGDDEFYVLGDNRNSSKDSRSFGPVGRSFVTGRVLLRGWPFNKFGVFEKIEYGF